MKLEINGIEKLKGKLFGIQWTIFEVTNLPNKYQICARDKEQDADNVHAVAIEIHKDKMLNDKHLIKIAYDKFDNVILKTEVSKQELMNKVSFFQMIAAEVSKYEQNK